MTGGNVFKYRHLSKLLSVLHSLARKSKPEDAVARVLTAPGPADFKDHTSKISTISS